MHGSDVTSPGGCPQRLRESPSDIGSALSPRVYHTILKMIRSHTRRPSFQVKFFDEGVQKKRRSDASIYGNIEISWRVLVVAPPFSLGVPPPHGIEKIC